VNGDTSQLVAKLWSYCNVLRDDGLSYQDYLEQLTFLLFLKMADEREAQGKPNPVPEGYRWSDLAAPHMEGSRLEDHYRKTLEDLGKMGGMLGLIFRKAQNKIQDPAKLRQLIVELIGKEEWLSLTADVKGDAYEGLLERNAQDVKSGAGQYFTPRPLIDGLIDCVQPRVDETVCDPACGTGGFLLSAYHYIVRHNPDLDRDQKKHLKYNALRGVELVDGVSRLCAMNLLLHGIGPDGDESEPPIRTDDSLRNEPSEHYPVVVTNPPFGKKSSITVVNDEGEADKHTISYSRPDFWTTTTNKQLNFVQHIKSLLEQNGRAAVVVPDNVLSEGGAGETVRRKLMHECDLHTVLRLPTGIFYAQGVKANVIFFDRKPASETPWTKTVWFYDLRTNMHFTLKQNRLERSDLDEFVACYHGGDLSASDKAQAGRHNRAATWTPENPEGRWRPYTYGEIIQRDKASLDIAWLRDESLEDSANLPDPEVLAAEIIEDLQAALEELQAIQEDLAQTPGAREGERDA
jgi:type I restriction enzyme M protein